MPKAHQTFKRQNLTDLLKSSKEVCKNRAQILQLAPLKMLFLGDWQPHRLTCDTQSPVTPAQGSESVLIQILQLSNLSHSK